MMATFPSIVGRGPTWTFGFAVITVAGQSADEENDRELAVAAGDHLHANLFTLGRLADVLALHLEIGPRFLFIGEFRRPLLRLLFFLFLLVGLLVAGLGVEHCRTHDAQGNEQP